VARMGEEGEVTGFGWESWQERDHLEDQGVGRRMGSQCILGRFSGGV
jgi:hypothetical protein